MFLDNDERIIIMEDDYYFPFNIDDFKKIEDAGIKTVMLSHALDWREPNRQSLYRARNIIENTNLKFLFQFFYGGMSLYELSECEDDIDVYANEVFDYLGNLKNRVQLIYAMPDGGEFTWDSMRTHWTCDDLKLTIDFVISRQKSLIEQHNEMWLCFHNFLGHPDNWNNLRLPFLYEALGIQFPDVPLYSFQYAHFSCGGTPTPIDMQYKVKKYTEDYGVKFFVGSDYCEGLTTNFDEAMKQKAYGFVTSPMHSENPIKHEHVEDWMVDTLRETNKRINDYYSI